MPHLKSAEPRKPHTAPAGCAAESTTLPALPRMCSSLGNQGMQRLLQAKLAVSQPRERSALQSPGQPLDAQTRASMSRQFGHDFSDIRVHTDSDAQASAASARALAYAVGRDLVFGAGQYQPHSIDGRWLIAHELAHVLQQPESPSASAANQDALEREASQAAVRVALGGSARITAARGAPAVQFLRVSQGGFGQALEEFTNSWKVPDKAIRLLRKSPTFSGLASILDKHYLWSGDPRFRIGSLEMGPDGRLLKPAAAAGKRSLFVVYNEPSFKTFNTPGNILSGDVISVKHTDIPTFIHGIAHEATHAATFVGGPAPQPKALIEEIEAGVQEEIATRRSEANILGEIPDRKVRASIGQVGSRDPREVERDVSPAFNLTYLELFFFARELRDAQAAERLTDDEAMDIRKKIDKEPTTSPFIFSKKASPMDIYTLSKYAETWFAHQTAMREWEKFLKDNSPRNPTFATKKENLIQDHAKRFFKGKVSYRPLDRD